jgi:FMN-dependent NADH-azoreductase
MGIPIYNFSVPGSVKAYIDLISRTGVTFSYDDMGQVTGLLADKKVYIIVASGGTGRPLHGKSGIISLNYCLQQFDYQYFNVYICR